MSAVPLKMLLAPARAELEVRKSRFLAQAFPARSAAEALDRIRAGAEAEAGARHHCWAFRIGQTYRFHDAGEPGGTAGRPILAAIDAMGFDQVAVLVSRWFGGVLLGAGGLARAYGGAAAQALAAGLAAPIETRLLADIAVTFPELPRIKARLANLGVRIEAEVFEDAGVRLMLSAADARVESVSSFLRDATRGRAVAVWRAQHIEDKTLHE